MKIRLAFLAIVLCFPFRFSYAQELLSQNKANRLFNSGELLVRHSELGAAEKQFEDFLRKTPITDIRIPEAEYYKAFCALKLYHFNSWKQVDDFIKKNPEDTWNPLIYYDAAHFFYEKKDYKKAVYCFEKTDFSLLDEIFYIQGRFHWGYSLFNLKRLDEAREQFDHIKFLHNRFSPASSYYAGFVELKNGDYDNALKDLKEAQKNESYTHIVPYLMAIVYYQKNEYDTLETYLQSLKNNDVTNREEIELLSAELEFKRKNYEQALQGYTHYLSTQQASDAKVLLFKAGFSAYSVHKTDEALDYLRKSASAPDSIGFYSSYYLGAIYIKKGLKLLALNAFGRSEKYTANPLMVEESAYQKAKILYDMERFDNAADVFQNFIKNHPSSHHVTEAKKMLSQIYVYVANYDRAITYITSLSLRTPDLNKIYQRATWLKGSELFNKGDYAHAVQLFEKSLQYPIDKPTAARANFWKGETYSIGKKYELAILNYLQVIKLANHADPALIAKTRYALGYAFFNLKRYERALYNFQEFIKDGTNKPDYTDGMLRLADCYYVTKAYAEALSLYQQYMQVEASEKDYALLQIGAILGIQQQYDSALKTLNRIIEEYSQSRFIDEALFQKTQINFEQGNYATAVAGYTKLINEHPTSLFLPYAYMRRAASYYNLKEYTKTISDYLSILKMYPLHPSAKNSLLPLQEALDLAGRTKDFESYLAQYKEANPNVDEIEAIEFEAARHLYFKQEYRSAIKSFKNYLASHTRNARLTEARYYKAESYYRLGAYDTALQIYEQVIKDFTFPLINRTIARIAELEYNRKNYREAINGFNRLAYMATTKKEKIKAWLGAMESYFRIAVYDSCNFYANRVLEQGSANIGAESKASLFLGKSAMVQKQYETAKDEFINTINIAQDEYGAEAKYLLGELFLRTGDYKQCYETLIGLNNDFASYPLWVGKSFLLLSDNFIAMGDAFQAKGTLNSLIEANFPLKHIRDEAQKKLLEIEQGKYIKEKVMLQDSIFQNYDR